MLRAFFVENIRHRICPRMFLMETVHADGRRTRRLFHVFAQFPCLLYTSLLVPYPLGASRGDQIENAKSYARQGLARVLMQEDMTARTLTAALFKLCLLYTSRCV